MNTQTTNLLIPFMVLAIALLAFGNWMIEPGKLVFWIIPVLFIPAGWGIMRLFFAGKSCDIETSRGWQTIKGALLTAGLVLSAGLTLALLEGLDTISFAWSERGTGLINAFLLIFLGNLIPKQLSPLSSSCEGEPSKAQKMQRFTGWALVLAGLGSALAWTMAPIEFANYISMAVIVSAVILVLLRWLTVRTGK